MQTTREEKLLGGDVIAEDLYTAIGFNFRTLPGFHGEGPRKSPFCSGREKVQVILGNMLRRLLQRKRDYLKRATLNFPEPYFNSKNGSRMNSL